ncbi:MAG: hypothetical protein GWN00_01150 [Aliifodinibius sp.]|nr:hypothetical protein [Fodinibius sp.]NIV09938.1 hypothetical protein [Fodinibius sp.]NIY23468.1 hypothetical protein [Fodinibius sp.]
MAKILVSIDDLGGKGYHLCEMSALGLQVPSGIIIPTECCREYHRLPQKAPLGTGQNNLFKDKVVTKDIYLERTVSTILMELVKLFGPAKEWPLLSVRSGARYSMPGMMDTICNVGITQESFDRFEQSLGEWAVRDCHRRFKQSFGMTVYGLGPGAYEKSLQKQLIDEHINYEHELTPTALDNVVTGINYYHKTVGVDVPDNIKDQLKLSVKAVWGSWYSERARVYRKLHNIPDDLGTAVIIQQMVYGNRNDKSCSGVIFSRNPATGNAEVYGDYLPCAQGEDVVSGIRPTYPIKKLKNFNPKIYEELVSIVADLEKHYGDMQDVEFTVDDGELYILQTRSGKRSSYASWVVAKSLAEEGHDVKKLVSPEDYVNARVPQVDPTFKNLPNCVGIPAGGGVVTGKVVFRKQDAINCTENFIFIAQDTNPEDFPVMEKSAGILTQNGGVTSHAAVVARALNKSCVVGANIKINDTHVVLYNENESGYPVGPDSTITIDGSTGKVWVGEVPVISKPPEAMEHLVTRWLGVESFLPIGMEPEDSYGGKILIPFSYFDPRKLVVYGSCIRRCLESGIKVYVDLTPMNKVDIQLLSRVIPGTHSYNVKGHLVDSGLYDQVVDVTTQVFYNVKEVLDALSEGKDIDFQNIKSVFGDMETFNTIVKAVQAEYTGTVGLKRSTVLKELKDKLG